MVTLKINPRAKEMAAKITSRKVVDKVVEGVVEKVVEKLSSNQQKIVNTVSKYPDISAQGLAKLIGISPRKIQDNIAKLKDIGVLERIGPDKGGHWEVIKK